MAYKKIQKKFAKKSTKVESEKKIREIPKINLNDTNYFPSIMKEENEEFFHEDEEDNILPSTLKPIEIISKKRRGKPKKVEEKKVEEKKDDPKKPEVQEKKDENIKKTINENEKNRIVERIDFTNGKNILSIIYSIKNNRTYRTQIFFNDTLEIRPATYTGSSSGNTFWKLLKGLVE